MICSFLKKFLTRKQKNTVCCFPKRGLTDECKCTRLICTHRQELISWALHYCPLDRFSVDFLKDFILLLIYVKMVFPGWNWASSQQRLWLLFAFRKEALECALPNFHSIRRTDGFPNAWQFSQELCNTFWRSLHVFSKPSIPLSPHLATFQQALNPLPYVWVLPFPFCSFLRYFYKHPNRPLTLLWSSASCAISQHVSSSVELPAFSEYYKISQLRASDTRHLRCFISVFGMNCILWKRESWVCWKLFFSWLWKSNSYRSTPGKGKALMVVHAVC